MTCLRLHNQDFEIHEKNSTSDSIVVFVKTRKGDAALKITMPPTLEDNSLQIERDMYTLIKSKLSHWSPHFLTPWHSGHCSDAAIVKMKHSHKDHEAQLYKEWIVLRMLSIRRRIEQTGGDWKAFLKTRPASVRKTKLAFAEYLFSEDAAWKDELHLLYFVMTPRFKGVPLEEFLHKKNLPKDILRQIMVQISQALSVLAVHNIIHNDLHMFNLRIESFKTMQKIPYVFPRKVTLCTKHVITVFDFDRSASPEMKNTGLETYEFCKRLGTCSKFVPKFDFYKVIAGMIAATEDNASVKEERDTLIDLLDGLYDSSTKLEIGSDALLGLACRCVKIDKANKLCLECAAKSLHRLITPRTYFLRNVDLLKNSCSSA
jgi:hypothetical protein